MKSALLTAFAWTAPTSALIRFGCSSLTVQRIDPLVNPGMSPSSHLHQVIGGNSFNVTMDVATHDLAAQSTCTTCSFSEDFSNYWTATLFFKARNGSYTQVKRMPQSGFEGTTGGGMVVYYMSDALFDNGQKSSVTAFKKGFRMLVGDASFHTRTQAQKFRQLTFTCMADASSRAPETLDFPATPCKAGIMANHIFPTCWNGKDLDSPNHQDHVAYPASGTFESGGPCPASHPVKLPQLMLETVWDTRPFNAKELWPEDGSQPFVWSNGDKTGYGSHADYMFGWKDNSLQKAMDAHAYVTGSGLKTQTIAQQNKCSVKDMVNEKLDGWLSELPGGMTAGM
ncbi:uncharacterized protein SPSK_03490 [Sporothrix schenckii 1099-18]|uniref:DUF1996 domain-containing protein n=1 Tax=Sporothrix schenckii 1099-18 TaxID=1397361 RepID=A0A0F2LZ57_SPOSC|nr:uncharacterized protein SPSK_03490 [Sporothrix schenckii 1099-18]KJR82114.1 hypothetical protein SPSK_03490 [Sporothrix schenckii 1099-18]